LNWFKGAIDLLMQNPMPLMVIALLCSIGTSVLSMVPVLGGLAVALLAPVLAAGMMFAFREQHEGRGAQIEHLFRGFQEPGRLVPLVILGVPTVIAVVLVLFIVFATVGAAALQLATSAAASSSTLDFATIGVSAMIACLFGFLLMLAALALVIFAVPRVMFDGVEPVAAMKESLAASLSNFGPLLIFGLLFIGAAIALLVFSVLVGWIPLLGPLVVFVVWLAFAVGYVAVSNGGVYLAWRSIWPESGGATPPAALPPAPPVPPA
jgi:uncharacterized membrane protein